MSKIDWDKAPEGFPLWLEFKAAEHRMHSGWYRKDGNYFKGYYGAHWPEYRTGQFFNVHMKKEECLIVDGYLPPIARPSTAWSGEGLPPVGLVCEANFVGEWKRFELRYYGEAYVVFKTAFEIQRTRHDFDTCGVKFRPIRTTEQIAADEREAAILQMLEDAGRPDTAKTRDQAQLLYDAGWRKQPKT